MASHAPSRKTIARHRRAWCSRQKIAAAEPRRASTPSDFDENDGFEDAGRYAEEDAAESDAAESDAAESDAAESDAESDESSYLDDIERE